jgi:hypothetical protein
LPLLTLFLLIHSTLSQTAPQLSETFTSSVSITIDDQYGQHIGAGVWGVDQPGGRGVENYKFGLSNNYDVFTLVRYDLMKEYTLDNSTHCNEFTLDGTMPPVWGWVVQATYVGKDMFQNESVDIWRASFGYAIQTLAVLSSDTTTPAYYKRQSRNERNTTYVFDHWDPTAPVSTYFNIPTVCQHTGIHTIISAKTACISRDDVMARAKVWVTNKVPYNQGATYQGYREDCSGYVSMAWDSSQPGHTTQTMHEIASPITKADLLPGDCLLYAAEHVVLFGGWTDSSKTEYMGYEETKPGTGTIAEATPYPYWYSQSDFLPYRYTNICS